MSFPEAPSLADRAAEASAARMHEQRERGAARFSTVLELPVQLSPDRLGGGRVGEGGETLFAVIVEGKAFTVAVPADFRAAPKVWLHNWFDKVRVESLADLPTAERKLHEEARGFMAAYLCFCAIALAILIPWVCLIGFLPAG